MYKYIMVDIDDSETPRCALAEVRNPIPTHVTLRKISFSEGGVIIGRISIYSDVSPGGFFLVPGRLGAVNSSDGWEKN